MSQTNFERLQSEGLLANPTALTQDQVAEVNSLSSDEIDAIISVNEKLGFLGDDDNLERCFADTGAGF